MPHESGLLSSKGGNCLPTVRRWGHDPVLVLAIAWSQASLRASNVSGGMRFGTTIYPCSSYKALSTAAVMGGTREGLIGTSSHVHPSLTKLYICGCRDTRDNYSFICMTVHMVQVNLKLKQFIGR